MTRAKSVNNYFLIIFLIGTSLIKQSHSYLEFSLVRNQDINVLTDSDECLGRKQFQQKKDDIYYDQLCYFKDIAYYIELFYNNQVYHISIDLTSPYSWLKGSKCHIAGTNQPCQLLTTDFNSKHRFKHHRKSKLNKEDQSQSNNDQGQRSNTISNSLARIQGSNQIVEGLLEKNQQIQFWTKDSGRLTRLFDIFLLGFYIFEEKEKVSLHNTNFIDVTTLSSNLNKLTDGAFSLRFDENSQNSLLKEIFAYTQTQEKIITIYINGKESTLTIGQLSIKNSAQGYAGIVWVPFSDDEDETAYGKLPLVKDVMLQSLVEEKEEQIQQDEERNVFVVFSLSASYIGLPQMALNALIKEFKQKHNTECQISRHSFLQCNIHSKKQEKFNQNLLISMEQGVISLPFQNLVLESSKKKMTFNLRLISKEQNEVQKSFIILGQPYFQKYFTVLDYKKNRMGFAIKRTFQHNNFISTVALIRFVSFIFFMGCCFLLCFHPIKRMFMVFSGKRQLYNKKSPEGRRLKYQPIEQNPYEEISGTLKRVLQQEQQIQ